MPLVDRGLLQGVLVVQTVEPRAFNRGEVRLLMTAGTQLAPIVSEARAVGQIVTPVLQLLIDLAQNLWWTWDQESQEIFQELSPRGWQNLYHNAVAVLREVSDYELRVRLHDPDFAQRVRSVL